jgi:hypothetical protein
MAFDVSELFMVFQQHVLFLKPKAYPQSPTPKQIRYEIDIIGSCVFCLGKAKSSEISKKSSIFPSNGTLYEIKNQMMKVCSTTISVILPNLSIPLGQGLQTLKLRLVCQFTKGMGAQREHNFEMSFVCQPLGKNKT